MASRPSRRGRDRGTGRDVGAVCQSASVTTMAMRSARPPEASNARGSSTCSAGRARVRP